MDLHHLRYFIAVAEELSFRRAAERLHVSRPPLTRQIMALEEEVGARLLDRGRSRTVTLTDAGHAFLGHAKRALHSMDAAGLAARHAAHGTSGRLNVVGCALLAAPMMSVCLKEFRGEFPHVEVSFSHATHGEELDALHDDRAQLVISGTFGEALERRFESRILATVNLVVIMPTTNALAQRKGAFLDLHALREETLVTPTVKSAPSHDEFLTEIHQRTAFAPRSYRRVDGAENILGMVAAGYGVAILPECSAIDTPGCLVKRLHMPNAIYRLRMLWLRDAASPVLRNFLAAAGRVNLPDVNRPYSNNPPLLKGSPAVPRKLPIAVREIARGKPGTLVR